MSGGVASGVVALPTADTHVARHHLHHYHPSGALLNYAPYPPPNVHRATDSSAAASAASAAVTVVTHLPNTLPLPPVAHHIPASPFVTSSYRPHAESPAESPIPFPGRDNRAAHLIPTLDAVMSPAALSATTNDSQSGSRSTQHFHHPQTNASGQQHSGTAIALSASHSATGSSGGAGGAAGSINSSSKTRSRYRPLTLHPNQFVRRTAQYCTRVADGLRFGWDHARTRTAAAFAAFSSAGCVTPAAGKCGYAVALTRAVTRRYRSLSDSAREKLLFVVSTLVGSLLFLLLFEVVFEIAAHLVYASPAAPAAVSVSSSVHMHSHPDGSRFFTAAYIVAYLLSVLCQHSLNRYFVVSTANKLSDLVSPSASLSGGLDRSDYPSFDDYDPDDTTDDLFLPNTSGSGGGGLGGGSSYHSSDDRLHEYCASLGRSYIVYCSSLLVILFLGSVLVSMLHVSARFFAVLSLPVSGAINYWLLQQCNGTTSAPLSARRAMQPIQSAPQSNNSAGGGGGSAGVKQLPSTSDSVMSSRAPASTVATSASIPQSASASSLSTLGASVPIQSSPLPAGSALASPFASPDGASHTSHASQRHHFS